MDKSQTHKIYTSLEELPAWNFFKAREGEELDLRYLFKLDDYFNLDGVILVPELIEAWQKLFDEYVDKFSFSREHTEIMNLKREIEIAKAEYAISERRFDINKIRRAEKELDHLLEDDGDGKSLTFEEQVIMLETWRKVAIDSRAITCVRFFTLRDRYREEARQSQINSLKRYGKTA